MVKVIPHELVSERIVDQTEEFPVPETMDETVQVIQLVSQEPIQERIEEEIIDVPSSACDGGNRRSREAHPTGLGTNFSAAVVGDLVVFFSGLSNPTDKLAKEMTHNLKINFNKIAPFGKEDTAKELQDHAAKTQDTLVGAVENAEVAEIKREVIRALTRLPAAPIKEFDITSHLETQAIDAHSDAHHYSGANRGHTRANRQGLQGQLTRACATADLSIEVV